MGAFEVFAERGVTRLCHFTKVQSLTHILLSPDGILSTSKINKDILNQVDPVRADGKTDYVCCSIEYPNSWYLDNAKNRDDSAIFREWAIMYIDIEILKHRDVKVSECNAAKSNGIYICDGNEKNCKHLFENRVSSFQYPRTEQMLRNCPTNAQSEVMIRDGIPRDFIRGIAVGDEETAATIYAMEKTLGVDNINIYIAPQVLNKSWRTYIQRGEKPEEVLFCC